MLWVSLGFDVELSLMSLEHASLTYRLSLPSHRPLGPQILLSSLYLTDSDFRPGKIGV